jgi:hypothetical protein
MFYGRKRSPSSLPEDIVNVIGKTPRELYAQMVAL